MKVKCLKDIKIMGNDFKADKEYDITNNSALATAIESGIVCSEYGEDVYVRYFEIIDKD